MTGETLMTPQANDARRANDTRRVNDARSAYPKLSF